MSLLVAALLGLSADAAQLAAAYAEFLNESPTTRDVVSSARKIAEAGGFAVVDPTALGRAKAGDRLMMINRDRSALLVVVGKKPLVKGFRMVGTHIDTPALRVDVAPLVAKGGRETLKATRYGGIKPYHWDNIPLALRGVVHAKGGRQIELSLGPREGFVFLASNLDPRAERNTGPIDRKREKALVVASVPVKKGSKHKRRFDQELRDRYGLGPRDLEAAEIYAVPTWRTRDVGLDRELMGAFGHDDRVCSYAALRALLDLERPEHTAIVYLVDREEIGSTNPVGARSEFVSLAVGSLLRAQDSTNDGDLARTYRGSRSISGDVTAGANPLFPEVMEHKNNARLGAGVAIMKFTGRGGKQGGSDASPELVARVTRSLDARQVPWQLGAIGRVDEGGGGTIAKFMARLGVDVLDMGIPTLSMHSAFDVVSKADLHALKRGYQAFLEGK